MSFNFGKKEQYTQTPGGNYLKGGEIHVVKFNGIEKDVVVSKKDGREFETVNFKFENNNGVFEHKLFKPDTTKGRNAPNLPSSVEQANIFLGQFMSVVCPELLDSLAKLKTVSWDQIVTNLIKYSNKYVGQEFKIKLIINKQGYADIPFMASVNKTTGEVFLSSKFIANVEDDLGFSSYEMKNNEANSKANNPTNMPTIPMVGSEATTAGVANGDTSLSDDLDLEL